MVHGVVRHVLRHFSLKHKATQQQRHGERAQLRPLHEFLETKYSFHALP